MVIARCKKIVHRGRLGLIEYQCRREVNKDGYCWQHHPDAIKKREEKAEKRLVATPFYMIHKY